MYIEDYGLEFRVGLIGKKYDSLEAIIDAFQATHNNLQLHLYRGARSKQSICPIDLVRDNGKWQALFPKSWVYPREYFKYRYGPPHKSERYAHYTIRED
jgi:hypothetical protein